MSNAPVETKRTYCKICMTQCGIVAEVQGDQILRVRGDKEHPLTQGYTCPGVGRPASCTIATNRSRAR